MSSKATYDFVLPILGAFIVTVAAWFFEFSFGMFDDVGFVPGIINLLNLLIAFFIAALAAVATFDRPGLDDQMKGEPARMKRRGRSGDGVVKVLTHRQFIAYLFGYLSFISILFLLFIFIVRLIGPIVIRFINENTDSDIVNIILVIKIVGCFVFFFLFFQIIITMLLGIYFLSDRLQFMNDPDD